MRPVSSIIGESLEIDGMSVCFGNPQGDELPQVAGEEDVLMDVYSDILNVPREYAAGRFNHQYDDNFEYDTIIH